MTKLKKESKEFFTQKELAERYQISEKTLEAWRSKGTGPKAKKINGTIVRYPVEEVLAFENKK
tara:strand:+ start:34 stop:222 length:189 start_codon:yes stop_codon:yes gene_type:complete